MTHHEHDHGDDDPEWTPKGAAETYDGFDVWDHGVFPTDINHGEQDPDTPLTEE